MDWGIDDLTPNHSCSPTWSGCFLYDSSYLRFTSVFQGPFWAVNRAGSFSLLVPGWQFSSEELNLLPHTVSLAEKWKQESSLVFVVSTSSDRSLCPGSMSLQGAWIFSFLEILGWTFPDCWEWDKHPKGNNSHEFGLLVAICYISPMSLPKVTHAPLFIHRFPQWLLFPERYSILLRLKIGKWCRKKKINKKQLSITSLPRKCSLFHLEFIASTDLHALKISNSESLSFF